jgi:ankyrin repeat protein
MEEIIEKLRQKQLEEQVRDAPEPISVRISREKITRKNPVTPPDLYYRSPQITNKFYVDYSYKAHPIHMCAASMESDAYGLLANKYQNYVKQNDSILLKGNIAELQQVIQYANEISEATGYQKPVSYNKAQELYEAVALFRSPELFKRLLKDVPVDLVLNEDGYTCYHYVSEIGDIKMIQMLEEHGDDPNKTTGSGLTPLMLASSKGNIPVILLLVKNGADLDSKDFQLGWTALHWAVYNNQYEAVIYLVQHLKTSAKSKDFQNRDSLKLSKDLGHKLIYTYLLNYINNAASWNI